MLQINGISLHVEDHGRGRPVLLLHGWPDSAYLWRNQIPFLVVNGFHAIAPDLRGFGRSDRPEGVAAYSLQNAVGDVLGILDAFGIDAADIVGHDWGAAVAWFTATAHPERVHKLVVLSVPHPLAPRTPRQREIAWYQLFFQFEGIAEAAARRLGTFPGVAPRQRRCRPLYFGFVTPRCTDRIAQLVPREPRSAYAGAAS